MSSEQAAVFNRMSLSQIRRRFAAQPLPRMNELKGDYTGEFIGPAWMRSTAGPSLAPTCLRGWLGKRILDGGEAINRVRRGGVEKEVVPMKVVETKSKVLPGPTVALAYSRTETPFPFSRVMDEVRVWDDKCLLCLMVLDLPGARLVPWPFLLHRDGERPATV